MTQKQRQNLSSTKTNNTKKQLDKTKKDKFYQD